MYEWSNEERGLRGGEQEPSAQDGSSTAFRAAEKKYQLHKEQIFRIRGGKRVSKGFIVRPTDLSDVLDPQPSGPLPEGVSFMGVPSGMPPTAAAFAFASHPGLLLVRGALEPALQRRLIVDAFTRFCEPPNHTNHMRAYPAGLPGIWEAAQQGLRLQAQPDAQVVPSPVLGLQPRSCSAAGSDDASVMGAASGAAGHGAQHGSDCPEGSQGCTSSPSGSQSTQLWGPGGRGPLAESLLVKLRWATLGPPYDWTSRRYLRGVPHMPLPPNLRTLAVHLASMAAQLSAAATSPAEQQQQQQQQQEASCDTGQEPHCGGAAPFSPDAALVNWYYEGDTLNGHIDDAEPSLHHPLVSLSLGCDAVFLMGAHTKHTPPTPLLLHSGDAVVLSGPARRCYHGVPRVLPGSGALPWAPGSCRGQGGAGCSVEGDAGQDGFAPFARHMQRCRINISIRDTC